MKYAKGIEVANHLLQMFGLDYLTGVTAVDVSASVNSLATIRVSMIVGEGDLGVSTRTFEVKEVIE